eukprot:TRINITY_DN6434_c0_g1_i8.p1 TRINITY_DN6434_c0_g1~~TRINITY_DN6434_c0_g1_i8.p1  ORF type:complete len:218 (+),score=35.39 TRINITY_DN6434_c0_g1_i8:58-654(+)
MSELTPETVFGFFETNDLLTILKYRHLFPQSSTVSSLKNELGGKVHSNLVKQLADYASSAGLNKLLQTLEKGVLQKMAEGMSYPGYSESHKPSSTLMAKMIAKDMSEVGPRLWLVENKHFLPAIIDDLELEKPDGEDDDENTDTVVDTILEMADRVGMEFTLSSFSSPVLTGFARRSGLDIASSYVYVVCSFNTFSAL